MLAEGVRGTSACHPPSRQPLQSRRAPMLSMCQNQDRVFPPPTPWNTVPASPTGWSLCSEQDTPSTSLHIGPALPYRGSWDQADLLPPPCDTHHNKPCKRQVTQVAQWDLKSDTWNSDTVLFLLQPDFPEGVKVNKTQ